MKLNESSIIRNETVELKEGHVDRADLKVTADSRTWLGFIASVVWYGALLLRRIRFKGSPRLLLAFAKSFPS